VTGAGFTPALAHCVYSEPLYRQLNIYEKIQYINAMKQFMVLSFVSLLTFNSFAQSSQLDFYTRRFNSTVTAVDELGVLRLVASENIENSGSFFALALKRILVEHHSIRGNQEINAANDAARLIADQISTQGYADAAYDLWRTVEIFENPVVKMDALIALGSIGATEYTSRIILLLELITQDRSIDRLGQERVAYGAIQALENLAVGDVSAYLAVYYASQGWYGQWVKNKASESCAVIFEDPAEPLSKALSSGHYTYWDQRYAALSSIDAAENTSAEAKSNAATIALEECWSSTPQQMRGVAQMRKLAIDMIGKYGVTDPKIYPLLSRSYRTPFDIDEQLRIIHSLAQVKDTQAADLLASFIDNINDKQERGAIQASDERLMRALLPALGATGGSEKGEESLEKVMDIQGWNSLVRNLASQSLKK
jgi:hypothetical protein